MKSHVLALAVLLAVTGCGKIESTVGLQPIPIAPVATAPNAVTVPSSGLEQATLLLTVAEDGALVYEDLPLCPSKANILGCRNPTTVNKIKAADDVANAALITAKGLGTPAALSDALSTIALLGSAVPVFSAAKPAS